MPLSPDRQRAASQLGPRHSSPLTSPTTDSNRHATGLTNRRKSTSTVDAAINGSHLKNNLKSFVRLQSVESINGEVDVKNVDKTSSTISPAGAYTHTLYDNDCDILETSTESFSPRVIQTNQTTVLKAAVEASKKRRSSKSTGSWFKQKRVLFSRFLAWIMCFALLFGVVWSIVGPIDGLPGGKMFSLVAIYVAAVICGWLAEALTLPPLLGMLLAGIALGNIPYIKIVGRNMQPEWGSALRTIALAILLLRAGLGLDAQALRKLKYFVGLLGVVPAGVEIATYTVLSHFMLGFSWLWSLLVGFVLSPVSAAIIVPGMLLLQEQGLGSTTGIPTLTIAAASIDNVVAIVGFGISLGFVFTSNSTVAWKIGQGPLEVVVGIAYGIIIGGLLWFIPDRRSDQVATFRFGMLLGLGVLAIFGAQRADLSGAGALGCLTLAFVAGIGWRRSASAADLVDVMRVSALFSQLWLSLFQPLLFALIGAAVSFDTIDWLSVALGLPLLAAAMTVRACGTLLVLTGSGLSWREKAFVCIAWMSKASVQAAIGSVAYNTARRLNKSDDVVKSGLQVLTLAVLSIVVTAPLGAIGLKWGATNLLKPVPPISSRNSSRREGSPA